MKNLSLICVSLLAAAGSVAAHAADVYRYQCADKRARTVTMAGEGSIWLAEGHRKQLLQQASSASGARYTAGKTEWWEHGGEATLTVGKAAPVKCVPQEQLATDGKVTARISWLQRRLFPGATLEVKLLDVSRADAPAVTLSEKSMVLAEGAPLTVELPFARKQIDPRMTYAVQARLTQDGKLLMLNTTRTTVLTHGAGETADVLLVPVQR